MPNVPRAHLPAGFAPAALPTDAHTIHTPADGLEAGEVSVPVADGAIPAYRAQPREGGPFPVVLVVQEIFGIHEYIQDVCRRLAVEGYLAIAPDLYARLDDVTTMKDTSEIRSRVVSKAPDAQVMSDLDAALTFANAAGGDPARTAITGFCWGGRVTWLYAAHHKHLQAAVAWYGKLGPDRTELQPRTPIDVAGELNCPVLGLYGGQDHGIPPNEIEKMRAALASAHKAGEIVVYPDAGHGFHADYRPGYNQPAAADGWRRMLQWFSQHGAV